MSLKLGTTDISGVPTTLINNVNNKADASTVVNTRFDGQWVQKYLSVFSNVNIGSYSASLSSYLPNDGYSYEVMVLCLIASSNGSNFAVGTSPSPITNMTSCLSIFGQTASSSSKNTNWGILPIGTSRTIYEEISGAKFSSRCDIALLGYRRIGTNT